MSDSMIEQSAERLFSANVDKALLERVEAGEFPEALWTLASDAGFPMVLAAESAGGIGAGWNDAYPILRGLGRWQVPLPVSETMVAAMLLSMAGLEVPEGPIALIEAGLDNTVALAADGTLSGRAPRVPWARHSRWATVSIDGAGLALVDLRDPAVSIVARVDASRMPCDTVSFAGARTAARAASPLPSLRSPAWTLGAVARSMMLVGALEAVLEQSVRYANDRVQFGKPIGRYQAIQQQLALLAGDVACARVAALVAGDDAPSVARRDAPSAAFSAAVAKVRCGEAATRAASIGHQVHGAIGFTYEHMLNFSTRRLWAWREQYGTDAWWAQRLGEAAIAGRADGFWPGLTDRAFAQPIRAA
jgi:acyl-CoA dehydrogenase